MQVTFSVVISMEIFLLMAVHSKFRTTVSYDDPVAKYARYDLLRIPTLPHGPFAMSSPGESETTKLVLTW